MGNANGLVGFHGSTCITAAPVVLRRYMLASRMEPAAVLDPNRFPRLREGSVIVTQKQHLTSARNCVEARIRPHAERVIDDRMGMFTTAPFPSPSRKAGYGVFEFLPTVRRTGNSRLRPVFSTTQKHLSNVSVR